MDNQRNAEILLNIIDQRCKKILKQSNVISKIVGKIVEVSPDNTKASVKFAGDNNVFGLLNKTGEKLNIGDNVFVESIKDNLTNGFISEKFGVFKFNNITIETYNGSCNDINYTSFLWINNGTDCPPQLNGINYGYLTTKALNDDYIEQEFADGNSNNRYTRSKVGGTWKDWIKVIIQTDLDNINGEIISSSVPALAIQEDTTEHILKTITIAKEGKYMFNADVPINYYGATGRILYLKLKVNGVEKYVGGGVVNSYVYTLYTKLLAVVDVPAGATITITLQNDVDGKKFMCQEFNLQYFRLK